LKGCHGSCVTHEKWAYSLIEKGAISRDLQEKGYAPMKLLWGDATRTRSLMCQGGNVDKMTFTGQQNKVEMYFTLAAEASNESREKSRDISFFVDIEEAMQIHVADAKATTFQLDEPITLSDDKLKINDALFIAHRQRRFHGPYHEGQSALANSDQRPASLRCL